MRGKEGYFVMKRGQSVRKKRNLRTCTKTERFNSTVLTHQWVKEKNQKDD